jgi:hypothetical protein
MLGPHTAFIVAIFSLYNTKAQIPKETIQALFLTINPTASCSSLLFSKPFSMAETGNGSLKQGFKIPEIKHTKLFINGEYVDSVSGT